MKICMFNLNFVWKNFLQEKKSRKEQLEKITKKILRIRNLFSRKKNRENKIAERPTWKNSKKKILRNWNFFSRKNKSVKDRLEKIANFFFPWNRFFFAKLKPGCMASSNFIHQILFPSRTNFQKLRVLSFY